MGPSSASSWGLAEPGAEQAQTEDQGRALKCLHESWAMYSLGARDRSPAERSLPHSRGPLLVR